MNFKDYEKQVKALDAEMSAKLNWHIKRAVPAIYFCNGEVCLANGGDYLDVRGLIETLSSLAELVEHKLVPIKNSKEK
jgi:hypothetical protein